MKRAQLDRIGVACGVVRLISYAAAVIGAVGLIGVVGTSDLESELGYILHPSSWYFLRTVGFLALTVISFSLGKSMKPIWKWIRRTNYFYELGKYTYNSRKLQED